MGRLPAPTPRALTWRSLLTIADRMKKLGYITGFSGKVHLGPNNHSKGKYEPRSRGFDYYWTGAMESGTTNLTLDGKPGAPLCEDCRRVYRTA